jgi:hypothetical protein
MAHARLALFWGWLCAGCQGAAGSSPPSVLAKAPAPLSDRQGEASAPDGGAPSASFDGRPWGTFHSKRFELSLPLPDGASWKIDDHGSHWLKAEHERTHSTLWLRSWAEDRNVTRGECYAQAREWNASLPDLAELSLIDDRTRLLFGEKETRVAAGVDESASPNSAGFVIAIAGEVRRCFVVAYRTEAAGQDGPRAVADRLAFVADRLLSSVRLDPNFSPPRVPARGIGAGPGR